MPFRTNKSTSSGHGLPSASLQNDDNPSGQPAAAADGHRSLRKRFLEVITPRSKSKSPMSSPHPGISPATSAENLTGNASFPSTPDVSNTVAQTNEQGYAQSGRSITGKCPFVCVLYKAAYHQSLGSDKQPDQPYNDEKIESIMKTIKEVASYGFTQALLIAKESSDWNPFLKAVLGGVVAVVNLKKQVSKNWSGMDTALKHIGDLDSLVKSTEHLHGRFAELGVAEYFNNCVNTLQLGCNRILDMQSHGLLRCGLQATSDADTLMDIDNQIMYTIDNFKLALMLINEQNTSMILQWTIYTNEEVCCVTISGDSKMIASCGSGSHIYIWDALYGEQINKMKGHPGSVKSASFSPDSKYMVSGGSERSVCIWDVSSGKQMKELRGHQGIVYSVSLSPEGKYVVSGGSDRSVCIWNVSTGKLVKELKGHQGMIHSVSFSMKQVKELKEHQDWIQSASISPDGKHIVLGSNDVSVHI
ncbi:Vegetative incompatibility protein HET-E-1 [Termitomyces sp. J132]|nr:Vegetative incompatibility protein HET-E-1 [Termitomyces sp. J132]